MKTLAALLTLVALIISAKMTFAACPCQIIDPCCPYAKSAPGCECSCSPCKCCEDWVDCKCLEDYFCSVGLNECQKCAARKAIEKFKYVTQCLAKNCKCETKCECRYYRRALRDLDCKMKNIITKCQKPDYNCVRREIKDKVKCCHKCLIWPFKLCKCDCGCNCCCK